MDRSNFQAMMSEALNDVSKNTENHEHLILFR